jgi:hypothetical protein
MNFGEANASLLNDALHEIYFARIGKIILTRFEIALQLA